MDDEPLVMNMSVLEFCKRAKGILKAKDDSGFVKFVLTGQHGGHQAVVDPILHKMTDYEGLYILRDYDSLLGIHQDICVKGHLTVYPLARREDTLATNIHLKHSFNSSRVSCRFRYLYELYLPSNIGAFYCSDPQDTKSLYCEVGNSQFDSCFNPRPLFRRTKLEIIPDSGGTTALL